MNQDGWLPFSLKSGRQTLFRLRQLRVKGFVSRRKRTDQCSRQSPSYLPVGLSSQQGSREVTTLSFDLWKEASTLGTAPWENTAEAHRVPQWEQLKLMDLSVATQCSVPNVGVSFSPRENPTYQCFLSTLLGESRHRCCAEMRRRHRAGQNSLQISLTKPIWCTID